MFLRGYHGTLSQRIRNLKIRTRIRIRAGCDFFCRRKLCNISFPLRCHRSNNLYLYSTRLESNTVYTKSGQVKRQRNVSYTTQTSCPIHTHTFSHVTYTWYLVYILVGRTYRYRLRIAYRSPPPCTVASLEEEKQSPQTEAQRLHPVDNDPDQECDSSQGRSLRGLVRIAQRRDLVCWTPERPPASSCADRPETF